MNAAPSTAHPRRAFHNDLADFAAEIGDSDSIAVRGGGTAEAVGGTSLAARRVAAPVGIRSIDVAEMTVRVAAGTSTEELTHELTAVGQEVALGARPGGTVGGALAVGWSDLRRPRVGPARDTLLEADVVDAGGRLVRCGGPTVKNVTGYDLCRLVVGSLGVLACIGEVLLRTRPLPATAIWLAGDIDPTAIDAAALAPSCHLWDGSTRWVLLEGYPADVDAAAASLDAAGGRPVDAPPSLPPHRWSVDPATVDDVVREFDDRVVAEVGVGTLHASIAQPPRSLPAATDAVHERLRDLFDPTRRLNPGRDPRAR